MLGLRAALFESPPQLPPCRAHAGSLVAMLNCSAPHVVGRLGFQGFGPKDNITPQFPLSISEACTHAELGARQLLQRLPKLAHEACVAVRTMPVG